MIDLDGQVAIVTGAGSRQGIGFACAELLRSCGASVVVSSTTDRIQERAKELGGQPFAIGMAAPAGEAVQVVAGTSESFTDVQSNGADFDPSLGRRVRVVPRVTIVETSSFDWGDAGVGAAGAVGLILLAVGVAIVSRHGHRAARI